MPPIDLIAFDADDTLWHNESLYEASTQAFINAFVPAYAPEVVRAELDAAESRNIPIYGYGIKAFMLSMMETSRRLSTEKDLPVRVDLVLKLGRDMLMTKVRLFPYVRRVLDELDETHALIMITKGDLLDQQSKLERSGLKKFFKHIEVVTEKTPEMYADLLRSHNIIPRNFLMVGNSLRSDIMPVISIGGQAVHIPYHLLWVHEHLEMAPEHSSLYHEISSIRKLPALIKELENA